MNPEEIFRNVTVGVGVYDINLYELLLILKEHNFIFYNKILPLTQWLTQSAN